MNSTSNSSRPRFLTILLLGSAITQLLWILMFIVLIILSINGEIPQGLFPGLVIDYLQTGYLFVTAQILLSVICLYSIVSMWQQRKTGFYIYTANKIIVYFLPVLFIGYTHLTLPGLFITAIFLVAYGTFFTGQSKKIQ